MRGSALLLTYEWVKGTGVLKKSKYNYTYTELGYNFKYTITITQTKR